MKSSPLCPSFGHSMSTLYPLCGGRLNVVAMSGGFAYHLGLAGRFELSPVFDD